MEPFTNCPTLTLQTTLLHVSTGPCGEDYVFAHPAEAGEMTAAHQPLNRVHVLP
jgi:hypothetical protein